MIHLLISFSKPSYTTFVHNSQFSPLPSQAQGETAIKARINGEIRNFILAHSLIGWIDGISWEEQKQNIMDDAVDYFLDKYSTIYDLYDIEELIGDALADDPGYELEKFKSYKKTASPRLVHSLIKTKENDVFVYTNKVLGKGSYGKVVEGYRPSEPDNKVTIKRIKPKLAKAPKENSQDSTVFTGKVLHTARKIGSIEYEQLEKIGGGERLISPQGHMIREGKDSRIGESVEKYMIVMDYAGPKNGKKFKFELAKLVAKGKMSEAKQQFNHVMKEVIKAVAELHAKKDVPHNDLKLDNIIINEHGKVIIIDYGFVNINKDPQKVQKAGSRPYKPLEALGKSSYSYDQHSHDRFSLGVLLLRLWLTANNIKIDALKSTEGLANLAIDKDGYYEGTSDTALLTCDTDYKIIAKLLDKNPANRPTASELLQSPFMQDS